MNILGIFRKIVDIAGKEEPVVTAINPAAGLILSAVLQGIYAVQAIFPGSEHNEVKKDLVTRIATAASSTGGVPLTGDQSSLLIENLLYALQNAALGQHPPATK